MFRPVVLWNMVRLAPFTFLVSFFSVRLAAPVRTLAFVTLLKGWLVLTPLTAVATATALLIYGRLLGRLGWKMGRLRSGNNKSRPPVYEPTEELRPEKPKMTAPVPPPNPEELDPEWETTPYGQKRRRVKGYGVTNAESQITKGSHERNSDEEVGWELTSYGQKRRRTKSYGVTAEPQNRAGERHTDGIIPADHGLDAVTDQPPTSEPDDYDRFIRTRSRLTIRKKRSFLGGVFSFPWYQRARGPWMLLSLGFVVFYGAAYVIVSLYLRIYNG